MTNATNSPLRSARMVLVLLTALVLFAAACADDATVTAALEDAGAADPAPDDDAASDEADADQSDEAGQPDEPDEPVVPTGDASEYCRLSAAQHAAEDQLDPVTATPEQLEKYFTKSRDSLDRAIAISPGELTADLEQVAEDMDEFISILAGNDWDFFAAIPDFEAVPENPALDAAGDRLDIYDETVCGIDQNGGDDAVDDEGFDDPFGDESAEAFAALLESEFGRQAIITGMTEGGNLSVEQAECLLDGLTPELLLAVAAGAGDPDFAVGSELLGVFDACGVTPDQFE